MASFTVNELLFFVSSRFDDSTRDHIHATVHEFYTLDETSQAKSILLTEFDKILNADLIKEARKPRQTSRPGAKTKQVKDILDIWHVIDKKVAGKLQTTFVAADINRLPSSNTDNPDLKFLLAAVSQLQQQTESLKEEASITSNTIGVISNTLIQVNRRLENRGQGSAEAASSPAFHSPTPFTPNRSLPLQPVDSGNRKRKFGDKSVIISPSTGAIAKTDKRRKKTLNSEAEPFTPTLNIPSSPTAILAEVCAESEQVDFNSTIISSTEAITAAAPTNNATAAGINTAAATTFTTADVNAAAAPFDAEATPTDAAATPTDAYTAPIDAETAPTDASVAPTDAASTPTDAETTPIDAELAPIDEPVAPTDAAATPRDAAATPRDSAATPRDAAATPTDAAATPSDAAATPRDAAATPRDAAATPRDAAETPRDATATPSDAAATPSDAAATPSDAAIPSDTASSDSTNENFSDKVRKISVSQKWNLVSERKKRKIIPLTGTAAPSTLEGVAVLRKKPFWDISVSRLSEGTSSEKLKTFLQGKGIEVKETFVFPSKIKGTVAARVRVALEHKEKVLDSNIWPQNIRVQSWVQKRKVSKEEARVGS